MVAKSYGFLVPTTGLWKCVIFGIVLQSISHKSSKLSHQDSSQKHQSSEQGKARQGTLEASFGVLGSPAASQGPVLVPRSRHKRCQGPGASQKLLREGVGYLQECKTRGWAKCPIPIAKPWRTIAKKKTLQNHCKPQQKPMQNHGTP